MPRIKGVPITYDELAQFLIEKKNLPKDLRVNRIVTDIRDVNCIVAVSECCEFKHIQEYEQFSSMAFDDWPDHKKHLNE